MAKIYLMKSNNINDLEEEHKYKIGLTIREVNKRKKELQTGNPDQLITIKEFETEYPFKVEKSLHNYFKHKNIEREWFMLEKNDIEQFIDLCNKFENNFKILYEENYFFRNEQM
jgi:hypothetical protein